MRALMWVVEAALEAAVVLAVLFIAALIWVAQQVWEAFVAGLDGTPWAHAWRAERTLPGTATQRNSR